MQQRAFLKWRAQWVESYRIQKLLLENQMKELLREKAKKVLYQATRKKYFENMAMMFQTWRHRTTVLKIDHTKNELSSFITTKLTEMNRLKCLRLAEAIKRIQERELRF